MACFHPTRFAPYFVEPVIAGLDKNNGPFVGAMDTIGSLETAEDFVVAGTSTDGLFGMCETLWEPGLVNIFRFQMHSYLPHLKHHSTR
jgi:20S proteasome alpha/beta subunit